MSKKAKLWSGRFSESPSDLMEKFSQSVSFDKRLYKHDIAGSIAHVEMLSAQGIIDEKESEKISKALKEIQGEIESGKFLWSVDQEDVHMNIESALIEKIGETGKKLHTGRSRNDQIATDIRLYLMEEINCICELLTDIQIELTRRAGEESGTIMSGWTHMQPAQPVTFGHHLLAWNEMIDRDYRRLRDCYGRTNESPLGSAALAGSGYPIDRQMTASKLGFRKVMVNSLDAVSDRDFAIEFASSSAILMIHLSRIAEELVLWSMPSLEYIDIGENFCTGSSIMPQKKNPDVAELIRGKSGRATGNLVTLLMIMKAQPLAYNRDNQEDKEPLFDQVDTVKSCLNIFLSMLPSIELFPENMAKMASLGHQTATDLADYLVDKEIPFRDAYQIVGRIVAYTVRNNTYLHDVPLKKLREFSEKIDSDVFESITLDGSLSRRDHIGGTSPAQVRKAAKQAARKIKGRSA
ncbi:MAG: argininosuccinate lyase [Gammaproteobacteria bacterium]|nr:argininosuccinate lyase [Gammaproteobacteria bacterium]MCY4218368.1 argininosuccinate lyase [Gammaproteobacteria bacterium]MCY4273997.1 argininosuccinate lyase [Gammaproteobacteria bacterium]